VSPSRTVTKRPNGQGGGVLGFDFLFAVDTIIALAPVYYFIRGVGDGTVSSVNIGKWSVLLAGIAIPIVGGWLLKQRAI
jgi:hypothetical protein